MRNNKNKLIEKSYFNCCLINFNSFLNLGISFLVHILTPFLFAAQIRFSRWTFLHCKAFLVIFIDIVKNNKFNSLYNFWSMSQTNGE